MEVSVELLDGLTFVGATDSGHGVIMDAAPDIGGRNLGPRPMEMLLLGAGGCTSIDVLEILRKGRHDVRNCLVRLNASRATTDPKVFTRIHMHFIIHGRQLKPEAVERAVRLSAEKYCSASIMLGKTADITHDWEIVEEDGQSR